MIVLPFHFWRIRKADGLVIPRTPVEARPVEESRIAAMPHLIVREVTTALLVLAVALLISMFFNAPLAEQANPGLSPNPTKAPWYFMGLQELLMHFHPLMAVLVIPVLTLAAIFAIPWIDPATEQAGVWFRSARGGRTALVAVLFALVVTVAAILLDEFLVKSSQVTPATLLRNGLLPFIIVVVVLTVFLVLIRKGFSASRSEIVQALFTLLLTSFVVLTITGIWFRGSGMQLTWPGG